VVGKDPGELEKYFGKKIALPEEDIKHFNFVQYIAAFISSDKILFYLRCSSIFKKNYKNLRFLYSKVKLFFKKLYYYYFP
jgi:hypothetical protein